MTEQQEAALSRALCDPGFSHAENILVALRQHEMKGTPHEAAIADLHDRFIRS